MDKLRTLEQAADALRDGSQIVMGGGQNPPPMALLRQLARRGARGLRLLGITGGELNLDFMVGADAAASVETCSVTLGPFARTGPNFSRYVLAGRIKPLDNT